MTDPELIAKCAEVMGWRTFKEKRGDYELCVTIAPGNEREPWKQSRGDSKSRYTECSILEALKIGFYGHGIPNPLKDDAQAMALVKKFDLSISRGGQQTDAPWWCVSAPTHIRRKGINADLNRAIVECVSKLGD